jgi:hypothetical protein
MTTSDKNRFNQIEQEIQELRLIADEQAGEFLDAYDGKKDNTNLVAGVGLLIVVLLSVMHVAFGILGAMCLGVYLYSVHVRNTEMKNRVHATQARIAELRDEQDKL